MQLNQKLTTMKTQIENSINPNHKDIDLILKELNEIIEIATSCTSLDSVKQHFRTSVNFSFFKWGNGSSHIWVSRQDNVRILLITK